MLCLFRILLFFFNDTATTEIYTLSLHDALPISEAGVRWSDLLTSEGKVAVQKPAMSSECSAKDTSTSSIPDIFDAIADDTTTKTTELIHTVLNSRAQMEQSTAPVLTWPPTALDMGLEKAADTVPNDLFNFKAFATKSCDRIPDLLSDKLPLTSADNFKTLSICQDIVALHSKVKKLTP